jgi:DNA-directed RNA polymerase subunit RPC12/RpoP
MRMLRKGGSGQGPSTEASEITYIVEYRCPRCGAALEARSSQAYGWLRCPRCGRAALPPEFTGARRPRARGPLGDDFLIIGPEPRGDSGGLQRAFRAGSVRRITGVSAFFLLLLLALFAWLERGHLAAFFFTAVALCSLAFAVYPGRRL